jgi:ketosteroid isomerase-like protein
MTQADLEALQRIYERRSEGDWRAGQEALSEDVVFVADDPTTGRSTYHGPGGVTHYMREFLSSWRFVRHVAHEFVEKGDRVFVAARQMGAGKQSGVEAEQPMFAVWTFRDGKVIRLEHFRDRAAALDAAELQDR